ncbi:MAG: FkbM family methyltransferase [Pseudomonadota bacterium]
MKGALGLLRSLAIYHNPVSLLRWRRFYRDLLRPGDLAFDIGAHVGTRSRTMHWAGARVVAIEPQAPFTQFLRRSLPRGIDVLDVAVGAASGQMELAVSSRHPTVSTLNANFVHAGRAARGFEHVRWDRAQRVDVLRADDVIAQYGVPRYIKIDVEGGEADVLAGLSHPVEVISAEYLPAMPDLAHELVARLAAIGNDRFNVVQGETGRFLWPDWRAGDHFKSWLAAQDSSAMSGDLFARRGA